jgi:hypothetical protein
MLVTKTQELKSFSNVAVASFIVSYARCYMYENFWVKCGKELYYLDTDSLYTTIKFLEGKNLGEIKLEEETDEGVFLLPKTYITDTKLKMKGFEAKTLNFNFEDFINALQGEMMSLKYTVSPRPQTFKTSTRKKQRILSVSSESEKRIISQYDKREVIKDGNIEDWVTIPWNIS